MNHGEKVKFIIKCTTCGVDVPAKRKTRRFCSPACVQHRHTWKYTNPEIGNPGHELLATKGCKPRKGEVKNCSLCDKEIYVLPTFLRQHKKHYCCKQHMYDHKKANTKPLVCLTCKVCPNQFCVQESNLKWRPRSTCSKECNKTWRRKQAEDRRKTYTQHQIDRLARYSIETELWRKAVFARDDYTCQMCGVRGTYLEADHIKPWAYFKELRHEITNGRTLCKPCHNTTKISAKKMKEIYGSK